MNVHEGTSWNVDQSNHKEYLPSTVVFYTEVVKLVTSVILVINESRCLAAFSGTKFVTKFRCHKCSHRIVVAGVQSGFVIINFVHPCPSHSLKVDLR